jgi:3-dehydroquinate synthetase
MAAELSMREGLIQAADAQRLRRLVERAGLPHRGPAIPPARMHELMAVDKKVAEGQVRFVLLSAIGTAQLRGGIARSSVDQAILAASQ